MPMSPFVVSNDFHELQCWQLAHSLRERVNAICAQSEVSKDYRFCSSFRNAAGSACRNISEGFTRFTSPSIVLFFGYALSSIAGLKDHFKDCLVRKAIDQAEYARLLDHAEHVKATALNFAHVLLPSKRFCAAV